MENEIIDIRKQLQDFRFEHDLIQRIPCTNQDNETYQGLISEGKELPEGVFAYENEDGTFSTSSFYTIHEEKMTDAELTEYLTFKQLKLLKTIKNCVVFFTVLTILGIAFATALIFFVI